MRNAAVNAQCQSALFSAVGICYSCRLWSIQRLENIVQTIADRALFTVLKIATGTPWILAGWFLLLLWK